MKLRYPIIAALASVSAFALPAVAHAQEAAPAAAEPEPTEPDQSDATADAAIAEASPVDDLNAKIELLQAQVEALQAALEGVRTAQTKATPSWKGAPLLEDKEAGWSFKPRGRIQYDVGFVANPQDDIITRNLGFNTRVRRLRLGAEGTIPGGFGYKAEMDFANSSVGFGDVIITYTPAGKPWNLSIGNHETLNGLEQMSSSRFLSFLERAAFDDAFINTRRIGLSGGWVNQAGTFRVNGGLFAAHSIDSTLDNDGWIAATRAVYSPISNGNQLHFGFNLQHRNFQSNNGTTASSSAGQPSTNQLARYRARPFTQLTDVRFVDTQNFAAKSDTIVGLEVGGVFKSLHVVAEGQYLKANAYDRGDTISGVGDPLDLFPSASQFVPTGNPGFWGGYVEAGYYFTGETRGYKNGLWDRTKVLKPFSQGGWGALQLNGRLDYLDLDSSKLKNGCTNNFTTGVCSGAPQLQKGGKQLGLLASLIWLPEDYMRFYLQGAYARITGGPSAATVVSNTTEAIDERDYESASLTARAQIDF
jgi:phosphate-selective porin OprO/OprP